MLINPCTPLPVMPGTRILAEPLGLVGVPVEDPRQHGRTWTITNLFAPIHGRALGGIRAKLLDYKGFISFINQRDLELLLDVARPGEWCPWLNTEYPGVNSSEEGWFGICCDVEDMLDERQEYNCYFDSSGVVASLVV